MNFYLVGGAVRDRLLGLEPKERDWVVVGATVDELLARGFKRLDAEFPVFAHPQTGEEYALARRERKTAPGHKGFVVEFGPDVTLKEDLLRRDLRLNAIAESDSGQLIDPYGGRKDIESRTLHHVSPAFAEDPLRVLRVARLAARLNALGFSIHPSTMKLMRAMSTRSEMGALSPARIWRETEKALGTDAPARYFTTLAECGALAILLPEARDETLARDASCVKTRSVLSALKTAASLDSRGEVRFATLASAMCAFCDSAALDQVWQRYPLPKRHAELARTAVAVRSDLASAAPPAARQLLAALEHADAFRRADRFEDALLVLKSLESAGDEALRDKTGTLKRAFGCARAIGGAALSAEGFEGKNLAEELHRRRLDAIDKALKASGKSG